MIEIVDHTPAMQREVIDLIVAIQRDEFGIPIDEHDQPDLFDVPGFYQSGAGGFWVARADGLAVGTIAMRDIGNRQAALRKMFVKPDYRGREHAVGARLLAHLVDAVGHSGLRTIYLGTTEKFTAAHRFYEKNGFERVHPEDLPQSFPRMALDTRFYRLAVPLA